MKKKLTAMCLVALFSNALYGQSFYFREPYSSRVIEVSLKNTGDKYLDFKFCNDQRDSPCEEHIFSFSSPEALQGKIESLEESTLPFILKNGRGLNSIGLSAAAAFMMLEYKSSSVLTRLIAFIIAGFFVRNLNEEELRLDQSLHFRNALRGSLHAQYSNDTLLVILEDLDKMWEWITENF